MVSEVQKTARHWNKCTEKFFGRSSGASWWEAGPEIYRYINQKISGNPDCDYTTYTLRKYFNDRLPLKKCLSLGCGTGGLERSLGHQGAFQQCDAYDVAEGSIQLAINQAREEGLNSINYFVADVNKISLQSSSYDSVWIQGAMHHFESLEHVSSQIKQALKPDGLLILQEYVGPSRFRFPERQKEITNLCLQLLPANYRKVTKEAISIELERSPFKKGAKWFLTRLVDKVRDGDLMDTIYNRLRTYKARIKGQNIVKSTVTFPSVNDVIATDPSEAIRSEEIIPVLQQHFEIIEMKEWGGNILQFLLADIAGNFAKEDKESQALLRMLMNIEETLLLCGELKSDFSYIVAKPLAI